MQQPAISESPRGSPTNSPSARAAPPAAASSPTALTPEQEAKVQEAVMGQLKNYGEGMVSKEHRATLAEYAACVLQTQATVADMIREMEQFLQKDAEDFVDWLIKFCDAHDLARPEKKAKKAVAPPRGGGLFSKALRAATGQPPASSSSGATANGTSPSGGVGVAPGGSGKKRGAEEGTDGPTGGNKIARREMRAIVKQADEVRLAPPEDSSRHHVRLVGRKELNQRAVAVVRRSLGEPTTRSSSTNELPDLGTLAPLVRSPPPPIYQPPLRRPTRASVGGLPPVEQQLGGGYVAHTGRDAAKTTASQPPPPPLPPPTQPQPRQTSYTAPPATTPQRNEDGFKWRAVRDDALVRATCEPDSAPVASITNGEIVEQCGQRIVLQSGTVRIQVRHPSHPSFPAPLGWVTLTAEASGGVRYFEKGPDKVRYSDSPTSGAMYGGKGGKGKGKGKGKGAMASGYYGGSFSPSWGGSAAAGYSQGYYKPGFQPTGYYYGGYKGGRGAGKGAYMGASAGGPASFGNIKWTPPPSTEAVASEAQR